LSDWAINVRKNSRGKIGCAKSEEEKDELVKNFLLEKLTISQSQPQEPLLDSMNAPYKSPGSVLLSKHHELNHRRSDSS
jgi:hypothetical protein